MNESKPEFHLRRVGHSAVGPSKRIFKIAGERTDLPVTRRGFIGTGMAVASALSLLGRSKASANSNAAQSGSVLYAHTAAILDMAFTPDSSLIATYDSGGRIKLWRTENVEFVKTLYGVPPGFPISGGLMAITPDGGLLTALSDPSVMLWSLPDGEPLRHLSFDGHLASALALTPDGKTFVTLDETRIILRVWTLPNGQKRLEFETPSILNAMTISPDGNFLAVGDWDGHVYLHSIADGSLQNTFSGDPKIVWSLVFVRNGDLLISGLDDGKIEIWSVLNGERIASFTAHSGSVRALAVTPDGRMLVSSGADRAVKFWWLDASSHVDMWPLPGLPGKLGDFLRLSWVGEGSLEQAESVNGPWSIARNQNNPQTVRADGKKMFFRLNQNDPPATLGTHIATRQGNEASVASLAISPDGKLLVSGDDAGQVSLWDLTSHEFRGFLFDPEANREDGVSYEITNPITHQVVTYTLPCGSPIPANATCVCNCVSGTRPPPSGGGGGCSIIICTCDRIFIPSDRAIKSEFSEIDRQAILNRLLSLPVRAWNYNGEQPSTRHVGPMAQDFAAAFGLGNDDRFINAVDAHGVTFAAIQALHELLDAKTKELNAQRDQTKRLEKNISQLTAENLSLNSRLHRIEDLLESANIRDNPSS